MNFRNVGDAPHGEGKPPGNFPLARQPSVYSLTFEEFQNTWGGLGKDFGSMNMDELLKNIWNAEESQAMTTAAGATGEGSFPDGNLQRQGSLTLPRTLSQKTVDEVWRYLMKENSVCAKDGSGDGGDGGGGGGSNVPQRQQNLGEMTLEEFLVRAGAVREDTQQIGGRLDNGGFYVSNNNTSLALGFQLPNRNNGLKGNRVMQDSNSVPGQPPSLTLNVDGVSSSQQPQQQTQQYQLRQQPPQVQQYQLQHQPLQVQQHQYLQQQQQPLFPKQATVAFASPMNIVSTTQLTSPGARGSLTVANPSTNSNVGQAGGLQGDGVGVVGLGAGGVTLAAGSPASQVSSDVIAKSTIDTSSPLPVPYLIGGGRRSGALEKVVERRHRRMIKNRESAARSRARKQAYTLELEAEVAKLKEMNQELQEKQEEKLEIQKNQIMEKIKYQSGGKRQCLRRTLTGPW